MLTLYTGMIVDIISIGPLRFLIMNMRTKFLQIVNASVLFSFVGCSTSGPPLWYKSDARVRSWLLRKTPIGADISEVRCTATKNGWEVYARKKEPSTLTGAIGSYELVVPFLTVVTAEWQFNSKRQLTNILVRRETNPP